MLIRAVSFLDRKLDFELTVIGDGVFKNEYMDLANSLGLKDKVIFKGAMSHEDIGAELEASDIFILPSFPAVRRN